MSVYLLDTNMASHIMRDDIPAIGQRLKRAALADRLTLSVISQAELYYGWARRGRPVALGKLLGEFLRGVDVLSWTESVARTYGDLRAACEASGISLSSADMMIAAHAKTVGAVLVTRDAAFHHLQPHITVEDWAK